MDGDRVMHTITITGLPTRVLHSQNTTQLATQRQQRHNGARSSDMSRRVAIPGC